MRRSPEEFERRTFDVLVIGGGVQGACIAHEAALRGLSVALVERDDFGAATSANSQKTIHGGLRYLQTLDWRRVRESARELYTLQRIAPHLVQPLPFVIPTGGRGLRSRAALRAALGVYNRLTHDLRDTVRVAPPGRVLSRDEFGKLFPTLVDIPEITGGALWYDGQAYSTERLTLAFVRAAVARGAVVTNYAEVRRLKHRGRQVVGAVVEDRLSGGEFDVRARHVINAAGPWAPRIAESAGIQPEPASRLLRAWNVVVPVLHPTHALGLSVPSAGRRFACSGRMLFMTPWGGSTIVGTLYAPADADTDTGPSERDVDELLDDINRTYPAGGITRDDVRFRHHGLLPTEMRGGRLIPAEHAQIIDHEERDGVSGLHTVVAVKYTTARRLAEQTLDVVCRRIGADVAKVSSADVAVDGGDFDSQADLEASLTRAAPPTVHEAVPRLARTYGTRAHEIVARCAARFECGLPITPDASTLRAEVLYAVREEMAVRLSDVVLRRTALGAAGHPGTDAIRACAELMADELVWSAPRTIREIDDTLACYGDRDAGTATVLPQRPSTAAANAVRIGA